MSVLSSIPKNNTSGTITFIDGAATELELQFDRGDLSVSNLKEVLNENIPVERRGKYIGEVYGGRIYPAVSFSSWLTAYTDSGSAPGDVTTWIQRTTGSAYENLVSTLGGDNFAFDIRYTMDGLKFGDSQDHTFTLHDCIVQDFSLSEPGEGNQLSLNIVVRGEVTGDLDMDEVA